MMAEHTFADPTRKTPIKPAVEAQQKETTPPQVETNSLVDLQRLIGNQGLQRMLAQRQIQAKLTVGAADDVYEQEADRVAKEVMSGGANDAVQRAAPEEEEMMLKRAEIQRAAPEEEEMMLKRADIQRAAPEEEEMMLKRAEIQRAAPEEEELLQGKRAEIQRAGVDMSGSFDVDDNVEGQINSLKGSGQSLSGETKDFMESSFGQDFSGVRVHTGGEADTLNRSIGARAFTTGSDIFMRSNEYNPDSTQGKELLAHELTHVVQQTGGKAQTKRDDCDNC
jgi:hypothetical protein